MSQAFTPNQLQNAFLASSRGRSEPLLLVGAPGSGKTAAIVLRSNEARKSFLVVPGQVADGFRTTLRRLGTKSWVVATKRSELPVSELPDVLVVTHALAKCLFKDAHEKRGDRWRIKEHPVSTPWLTRGRPDFLAVDECHHFANPDTVNHQVLRWLARCCLGLSVGASGTPVVNRPEDLSTLLSALGASKGTRLSEWVDRSGSAAEGAEGLRASYLVKAAVPEGPRCELRVVYKEVDVRVDPARYNRLAKEALNSSRKNDRTRMMECFQNIQTTLANAKREAVEREASDEPDACVIVTPFRTLLESLALTNSTTYTGADSPASRAGNLAAFLRPDGPRFLLMTSGCGAEGLDGLQTRASRMVVVSPPWSSAQMDQICARLHRRGQEAPVVKVVVLLARANGKRTLDHLLVEHASDKRRAASMLLEGGHPSGPWRTSRGHFASRIPLL